MQTIYNAQGEPKTCDAVDAREHIATGRWFSEAPVAEAVVTADFTVDNPDIVSTNVAPAKRGRK